MVSLRLHPKENRGVRRKLKNHVQPCFSLSLAACHPQWFSRQNKSGCRSSKSTAHYSYLESRYNSDMGCLPFRREGLGDASIRSSRASTTASPVSDGTEDIAEATFLEMSRLLKSHRKAVTPSFIARLFGKQSAVLRSSVQGYLDKLRTLQATFEEQKRALPGIGFSTRTGESGSWTRLIVSRMVGLNLSQPLRTTFFICSTT